MRVNQWYKFDSEAGELRTIPAVIKNGARMMQMLNWAPGVECGADIEAGQILGKIHWSDGTNEDLLAPRGCTGRLLQVNKDIPYYKLHIGPSSVLIQVEV
jgi:hypothetical protein